MTEEICECEFYDRELFGLYQCEEGFDDETFVECPHRDTMPEDADWFCPIEALIEEEEDRIARAEVAQANRLGIGPEQDRIEAEAVERECSGASFYEAHEWPGDSE